MSAGLQSQRTELAWLRTTLSAGGATAIAARGAFPVALLALAGPVAVTLVAHARRRRLAEEGVPPALTAAQAMPVAAACVLGALAAVLLL